MPISKFYRNKRNLSKGIMITDTYKHICTNKYTVYKHKYKSKPMALWGTLKCKTKRVSFESCYPNIIYHRYSKQS